MHACVWHEFVNSLCLTCEKNIKDAEFVLFVTVKMSVHHLDKVTTSLVPAKLL